jgi:hypothetical protein
MNMKNMHSMSLIQYAKYVNEYVKQYAQYAKQYARYVTICHQIQYAEYVK